MGVPAHLPDEKSGLNKNHPRPKSVVPDTHGIKKAAAPAAAFSVESNA
jgi:hypothetical protein